MKQRIVVDLAITAAEYQRYYSGSVRQVLAHTSDGRRVRFPANILQQVVDHSGVHGRFAIDFSADGKFLGISRLR
ncbi:MAG: DUF2835 domain-containing protein [Pseudomonadota bacterium]|nr:DUF2835 domain-containing protein [Pseudomonadota bacterium]